MSNAIEERERWDEKRRSFSRVRLGLREQLQEQEEELARQRGIVENMEQERVMPPPLLVVDGTSGTAVSL